MRGVEILQDAPKVSSDGGLIALAHLDESLGLTRRMAACLKDPRKPGSVVHHMDKMLRQRVLGICAGWEDCNDFDALADDDLYRLVLGERPASQPVLSRFENTPGPGEIYGMSKALVDLFCELRAGQSPKRIVLDLDATDDPAHGQQEFEFYHGYYQTHCFLPLLAFASCDGGPMEILGAVLRPGNSHAGRRSSAILRRLVLRLRESFPGSEILVRGDAGFALPEMYETCEDLGLSYLISLPKNPSLRKLSGERMQEASAIYLQTEEKVRLFSSFGYQAGSWEVQRRVIAKSEVTSKGENPRYVVTNLQGDPEELYKLYVQRGDSENRIKELKLDLASGRTSCHRFLANAFRLMLHACAFALMSRLRQALEGTALARASFGQIRLKFIKIAAIVQRSTRRILIRLPRGHPHAELVRSLVS